jgi:hypothetical protein
MPLVSLAVGPDALLLARTGREKLVDIVLIAIVFH